MKPELQDELVRLLGELVEETATAEDQRRLRQLVADDAEAREYYYAYMAVHAHLLWKHGAVTAEKARGWSLEARGQDEATQGVKEDLPTPVRRGSDAVPTPRVPRSTFHWSRLLHPMTLVLLVGLLAAGVLVYKFSTQTAPQPVAHQPAAADAVAKVVGTTDAQWSGAFGLKEETIKPGQRLVLQRGLVEILFGKQARVILEGPADFVVNDAATCRLDGGKLTAHVPEPARGFKVHTPDGTVTDLGTEFGVYVKSEVGSEKSEVEEQKESEQQDEAVKLPPITEVHVFKGQVDITTAQLATAPESKIQNPKSKILSAGQAVTISNNHVQTLPAADPFKFALDKLQGKPRTVLLSDDFESYPFAPADDALARARPIGPWIVQTSTRKGQGVRVEDDLVGSIAKINAQADAQDRLPVPPPSIGKQTILLLCAAQNPKDTYPLLAHPIDGRQLTGTCQVLFELELMPVTTDVQPSVALAADAGHAPGIELWRNADAAAPPIPWSRGQGYRLRVLIGVVDGTPREARIERSAWRGAEGWVRDASYNTPVPLLNWKTPPRYAIVGFPTVSPATPASIFRIDNVRVEVITGK